MALIPLPGELGVGSTDTNGPMPTPSVQPVAAAPSPIIAGAKTLNSSPDQAADAQMQLDVQNPPVTGFGSLLAQALDKNPIQLKPNGQPAPGSWGRSLVGAAQNVLAGLGDVPNTKAPVGAGLISGLSQTVANHGQRVAAQQEQAHKQAHEDEQDRLEQQRADDEHLESQANNTFRNMQMMHQQVLAHNVGIDSDIERGNRVIKMLEDPDNGHPAPIAAKDITYRDMQQGVIDGKWNLQDFTPYPTGKKQVGENPQTGDPLYETTYDLVNANGKFKPDDEEVDFLNKNRANEQQIQHGQEFTYSDWGLQHQQAANNATALEAKKQTLIKQQLLDAQQADELSAVNVRPDVVKALAESNNDPIKAISAVQARAQADPKFAARAGNIINDFRQYYGLDKDGKSYLDQMIQKAQESNSAAATNAAYYLGSPDKMSGENANTAIADANEHLKDPNLDAATKQSWLKVKDIASQTHALTEQDKKNLKKAADSNYAGDPNLTGDAYLATVPIESRQTIKQIADGQMPMANLSYIASRNPGLLDSVSSYDHQFDGTKVKDYADAYKDFTAGPTSKALNSLGTTLQHLRELYDATTPESFIPGTQAAKNREGSLNDASTELARYLAGGSQPDKDAVKKARESLEAGVFPGSWHQGAKTQAKLLLEKKASYQQQWDNAAPSDAYKRPMPGILPQAEADARYILNDGKDPEVATPGVPHNVIVNGNVVGVTTDGGKTMTPTPVAVH